MGTVPRLWSEFTSDSDSSNDDSSHRTLLPNPCIAQRSVAAQAENPEPDTCHVGQPTLWCFAAVIPWNFCGRAITSVDYIMSFCVKVEWCSGPVGRASTVLDAILFFCHVPVTWRLRRYLTQLSSWDRQACYLARAFNFVLNRGIVVFDTLHGTCWNFRPNGHCKYISARCALMKARVDHGIAFLVREGNYFTPLRFPRPLCVDEPPMVALAGQSD